MAAILAKDLRRTLSSGFFLMLGIAIPLVLAFVLSLVLGGVASGQFGIPVRVDGSDRDLEALVATLDERGVFARAAADDEDATVIVPGAPIEVVAAPDRPTSAAIVRAIVADGTRGEGPVDLVTGEQRARLDATTGLAASMATLFMFIIALLGVAGILNERSNGTLARLLAAPIRRESVLIAKALVSLVLALVAVTVMIVASTVLMDASWGSPLGLALLVGAVSLAATGLTLLIAGFASTIDAAAGIQSTVAVALALLGGAMVPFPDDGVLGALSRLSPHHWFLAGLDALAGGAAWTAALPAAAALLAFALVLGVPGTVLMIRRPTP